MAHRLLRPCRGALVGLLHHQPPKRAAHGAVLTRNYIAEMRKEAFEGNILRLIRNEIQYELDRSPPSQPPPEYDMFTIDEKAGEQWIRLKRKYGDTEDINVDVTMFDATVSSSKKASGGATEDDVKNHITMVVNVFKEECSNVLEFVCSVWPDSIQIRKVFTRNRDRTTGHPYVGPKFEEFDDDLQESLYDFLEERGINDEIAVFLHNYMQNKDKTEYIRWMDTVKSYISKKQKR